MFDYVENLKLISSYRTQAKPYRKIENRSRHGFIIKATGSSNYIVDGKNVKLSAGEMILLPKGSTYECYTTEKSINVSLNFKGDLINPEVKVYSLNDFYEKEYLTHSFSELWQFGSVADRYKCDSIFLDVISYISRMERLDIAKKKNYDVIEPAIKYLKTHIYDSSLKIEDLHKVCGVSDTYFRRIFKKRFNVTPQDYIISSRLEYAKSIFESGDFESVKEVAELVGYDDPMYFGKAFKKKYGLCPVKFND